DEGALALGRGDRDDHDGLGGLHDNGSASRESVSGRTRRCCDNDTVAAIPPQTLAIDCERVPQEAASTACVESNFVQGGRKVLSCDLRDESQAFLDPVLPAKQL